MFERAANNTLQLQLHCVRDGVVERQLHEGGGSWNSCGVAPQQASACQADQQQVLFYEIVLSFTDAFMPRSGHKCIEASTTASMIQRLSPWSHWTPSR